jgi:signal transduction histidine kinase
MAGWDWIRQRPVAADVLVAAALVAVGQLEVWLAADVDGPRGLVAFGALAVTAPVAWRRRAPLPALAVVVGAGVAASLASTFARDALYPGPALILCIYSVARYEELPKAVVGLALSFVAGFAAVAHEPNSDLFDFLGSLFFFTLLFGTPWGAGRAIRARQQRLSDVERSSEERAREAAAEERARIARELHDVVAHNVSVMVVQAGAERLALPESQAGTRDALLTIERTGREALAEMRRLLGMLREADDALALAPQPSLRHVGTLVEHVRAAGLPVELEVEGEPVPLPAGVDVSAYRIIQEALTNALKHAGPARARITVRYGPGAVELEISDDGRGPAPGARPGGHGLVGMRERVALYGGSLRSGSRSEGGYEISARLPFDRVP